MVYVPVQYDGHSRENVWYMYRYSMMVSLLMSPPQKPDDQIRQPRSSSSDRTFFPLLSIAWWLVRVSFSKSVSYVTLKTRNRTTTGIILTRSSERCGSDTINIGQEYGLWAIIQKSSILLCESHNLLEAHWYLPRYTFWPQRLPFTTHLKVGIPLLTRSSERNGPDTINIGQEYGLWAISYKSSI